MIGRGATTPRRPEGSGALRVCGAAGVAEDRRRPHQTALTCQQYCEGRCGASRNGKTFYHTWLLPQQNAVHILDNIESSIGRKKWSVRYDCEGSRNCMLHQSSFPVPHCLREWPQRNSATRLERVYTASVAASHKRLLWPFVIVVLTTTNY